MPAVDPPPQHRVRLLDAHSPLADAIPQEDRSAARRLLVSEAHDVPPGRWTPDVCPDGGGFALIILRGLVLREVVLAGRRAAQVFGPGDILRPVGAEESSLAEAVEWTVMDGLLVAVLDDVFVRAARRWPRLTAAVEDRLFEQVDRGAVHLAIAQLPRIEQRLLGMLWHLADRFGRVTPDGVVVPFGLTHDALGRLVGARRPTVSLGLSALQEAGAVRRRSDGCWLVAHGSQGRLAGQAVAAMPELRLRVVGGDG